MEKLGDLLKDSGVPNFSGQNAKLGVLLSGLLNIAFYIAVFLAFYWLVWGAWAYLFASGKKEDLAKARARISWALIGLIVIFLAYFIAKYASEFFPTQFGKGGGPF
ncbi:hypothetical protein HYS96_00790 [Candidatus Daviesbacteria bacterium]|nr:hypothetical protein [Candidatus Daviesbacteria bacterium]